MKLNPLLTTKAKKSKTKRLKKGSVVFNERKVQYYVLTHHKLKSELSNGQYKNVFDLLFEMDPPQKPYTPLFYQDQLFAVNKLLKYHLLRKQLNSESIAVCFKRAKQVVPKLYDLFVAEQSLQWSLKSVNDNMNKDIAKFLTVLIYFIMEYALVRYKQQKMVEAMLLYSILYNLCQQIVDSATSDRKVLRKVSEALLAYASFLINTNDLNKAVNVLLLGLKNESNILLTLSCRLKTTSKPVYRRNLSETYSRLFAIFFNLAYICQIKRQIRLSFMFLNQCKEISQLKMKILAKDANPNFVDFFQNCHKFHQQYTEVTSIIQSYFSEAQLKVDMLIPTVHRHRGSQDSELLQLSNLGTTIAKIGTIPSKMQKNSNRKKILKKSVSLKDRLHCSEEEKYYKNFGHQFLFYGVKLFDKYNPGEKKRNLSNANFSKNNYSQTHEEIKTTNEQLKSRVVSYVKGEASSSNLKKKTKKNNFFRQVQEPIQYDVLKEKFSKMWKEDELEVHKTHEQMYMLSYKSNNPNLDGLHKENKTAHEEIKFMNKRPQMRISNRPKKAEGKQVIKETGCNLFKRILLMKSKILGVKKTQTLNILKKKIMNVSVFIEEGYSSPISSVEFLKGQLEIRQERYTASKIPSKVDDGNDLVGKGMAIEHIFLTKDTVEIPNLFLSYITRSSIEVEFLAAILEYGLMMTANFHRYKR